MSEPSNFRGGGWTGPGFARGFRAGLLAAGVGLLALALGGCREKSGPGPVALYARAVSLRDTRTLEIQAQVSGPLDGVHYKWFAVAGECIPQETNTPVTRFRFATGSREDQITVDVWRDGRRIGQVSLDVRMADPAEARGPSNLRIEVAEIPPAQPGGPETRANIAGRVTGEIPPDSRVVIYARDEGVWYVQPLTNAKHEIAADGRWATWTHGGSAFAVLVVPADFVPPRTLDVIPQRRGDIHARVVVDGRVK